MSFQAWLAGIRTALRTDGTPLRAAPAGAHDGGLRPVTTSKPGFYPGAIRLAACAQNAGFTQAQQYPQVTDAAGKKWKPSGLQIILALAGTESSGNAFAHNINGNGSVDGGAWQVDTVNAADWDNPLLSPYIPWDCAQMSFAIHKAAGYGWSPWSSYNSGRWLSWRDESIPETWLAWSAKGITGLNAALAKGQTLLEIATVFLDEAP